MKLRILCTHPIMSNNVKNMFYAAWPCYLQLGWQSGMNPSGISPCFTPMIPSEISPNFCDFPEISQGVRSKIRPRYCCEVTPGTRSNDSYWNSFWDFPKKNPGIPAEVSKSQMEKRYSRKSSLRNLWRNCSRNSRRKSKRNYWRNLTNKSWNNLRSYYWRNSQIEVF